MPPPRRPAPRSLPLAFSTTQGNELLLAFIATDYNSGANTTVQSVSGAGLTWVLVVRTNDLNADGLINGRLPIDPEPGLGIGRWAALET